MANSCMHVLTLEGDKLYSLITHGEGIDVDERYPPSFCLDPLDNFVICEGDSTHVFSPEGNLLHSIKKGDLPGRSVIWGITRIAILQTGD